MKRKLYMNELSNFPIALTSAQRTKIAAKVDEMPFRSRADARWA